MAVDRDIYTNDVDFSVLALQDSEFNKQYVKELTLNASRLSRDDVA